VQDSNTQAEEGVRNKGAGEGGWNACDNSPHLGSPTPCKSKADFGGGREQCRSTQGPSPSPVLTTPPHNFNHIPAPSVTLQSDSVTQSEAVCTRALTNTETYEELMKPNFTRAPIKEAGRVAYLGMLSRCFLACRRTGTFQDVHV